MRRVHKTGDFIKEFDASLTGSVDYNHRVLRANNVFLIYFFNLTIFLSSKRIEPICHIKLQV